MNRVLQNRLMRGAHDLFVCLMRFSEPNNHLGASA
jgi:hypothetical protein